MSDEKELMDAAPAYLRGKVVAIFAYEDLGLEQAQRLREQGVDVIVTLRQGSSVGKWLGEGFCLVSLWDAADHADVFQVW